MYMLATDLSPSSCWLEEMVEKLIKFFPKRNPEDLGPWDQK